MDEIKDYVKELKELYLLAKEKRDVPAALSVLKEIYEVTDDPCGVDRFREEADGD